MSGNMLCGQTDRAQLEPQLLQFESSGYVTRKKVDNGLSVGVPTTHVEEKIEVPGS